MVPTRQHEGVACGKEHVVKDCHCRNLGIYYHRNESLLGLGGHTVYSPESTELWSVSEG